MEFTPAQAALRLRRLQALLIAQRLDAALLVPGVDSRDSLPTAALTAYLLEGRSGRDCFDTARLGLPGLDDAVVLVTPYEGAPARSPARRDCSHCPTHNEPLTRIHCHTRTQIHARLLQRATQTTGPAPSP
jgi:hypothetical protein